VALGGARGGVLVHREHATQHARHVAVENGVGLPVRDREHRGGGVRAHALQVLNGVHRTGDGAVVLVDDAPGGLVEVAGPGVEPEPLPVLKDGVPIGVREGLNRGKGLQKAGIVVAYGVDPRLLEHDFRDPNAVRVVRLAPGHRPLVLVVPVEHIGTEGLTLAVGGGEGERGNGSVEGSVGGRTDEWGPNTDVRPTAEIESGRRGCRGERPRIRLGGGRGGCRERPLRESR